MRKTLCLVIIFSLIMVIINADELSDKKTVKPGYCIELPFLNSSLNILKDNVCLGCASGMPLAIMIVVGFVALIILLFVWIVLALAGDKNPDFGSGAIAIIAVIGGVSFLGGIAVNILMPFYDYRDKTMKKIWSNPAVVIERTIGWIIAIGASFLLVKQISSAQN